MPFRSKLHKKNEHGDQGWWKKTGDTIGHYFVNGLPLCGTAKFNNALTNVQVRTCYDRRCKNCTKVRRNQLRARYNISAEGADYLISGVFQPKSHSPRKPQ